MNRKNKTLFAATAIWGLSNLAAYHILKYRTYRLFDAHHEQIEGLQDLVASMERVMPTEQLHAVLNSPKYDDKFFNMIYSR